jgi:phospholipid/cholesterol/gamma-HCH transport system substrate-binding protein
MKRPLFNKAVAVGLLAAVCGVAFLIAYTFFRKGGYAEEDTYVVYAYFDDATGLTWKSRVQIAGIQVGEVERIVLSGNRARLDLRIKRDIDVRADACLAKRFPSALLPDALLELTPGTTRAPSLRALPEDQREVKCIIDAMSVAKLLDAMGKIAADVQDVTRELKGIVATNEGSVKRIIENLARVSARVEESVEEGQPKIAAILDNTAALTGALASDRERYHAIARNVESASARLDDVLKSVQDILGTEPGKAGGDVKKAVHDVRESLAKLNDTMTAVKKVATDVSEGKGIAGKLVADERLGNKFASAVEGVSDYVDRLIKLQLQVGFRSEWLLNERGSKTYASLRLLPRPDKFYLVEVVNDPRGRQNQVTSQIDTSSGTTRTTTTTTEQKLAFSVEFGKRIGPVTLRIGLIESSGGVGADVHLLDDSLTISTNLYQFQRTDLSALPRAKLWADYRFLRYLYATIGSDDFLNAWRAGRYPGGPKFALGSDVFFGGGVVFTDDDLKTLFGVGGGTAAAGAAAGSK